MNAQNDTIASRGVVYIKTLNPDRFPEDVRMMAMCFDAGVHRNLLSTRVLVHIIVLISDRTSDHLRHAVCSILYALLTTSAVKRFAYKAMRYFLYYNLYTRL